MHALHGIDVAKQLATVEPGIVLDRLRDAAEVHHLTFAPDPATHWQEMEQACRSLMPRRVLVLADEVCTPPGAGELPGNVRGLLSKVCSADMLDAAIRLVLADGECFPARAQAARAGEQQAFSRPAAQAARPFDV